MCVQKAEANMVELQSVIQGLLLLLLTTELVCSGPQHTQLKIHVSSSLVSGNTKCRHFRESVLFLPSSSLIPVMEMEMAGMPATNPDE